MLFCAPYPLDFDAEVGRTEAGLSEALEVAGDVDLVMVEGVEDLLAFLFLLLNQGIADYQKYFDKLLFGAGGGVPPEEIQGIEAIHLIFELVVDFLEVVLLLGEGGSDPVDHDLYAVFPPLVEQLDCDALGAFPDFLHDFSLLLDFDVLGHGLAFPEHLQEGFEGAVELAHLLGDNVCEFGVGKLLEQGDEVLLLLRDEEENYRPGADVPCLLVTLLYHLCHIL